VLPGDGPGEIVAGGHFDLVDAGAGAVDDWSGVSLLPSLFESLKDARRRHTYIFIGFAAEETGLWGSKTYVQSLSAESRAAIRAMVNLECLGLSLPKVWTSRADPNLVKAYALIAGSLNIPRAGVNMDGAGDDDSHPFLDAHIPVITIHSVTAQTLGILHSPGDTLKAIHAGDYYQAYRLAAAYLTYLDSALP
jgi:Zn-dependent M28 family amino/carboxypeptidase